MPLILVGRKPLRQVTKPAPWDFAAQRVANEWRWFLDAPVVLPLWKTTNAAGTRLVNLGRFNVKASIRTAGSVLPAWVVRAGGHALQILNENTGANVDEIQFDNPLSIAAGRDFTFSFVVAPDYPTTPSNPGIWRSAAGGGGTTFIITAGASRDIWVRLNGTNILNPATTNYFPELERHIYTVVVRSARNVEFWVDGLLKEQATHTVATAAFTVEQIGWQSSPDPIEQLGGEWETIVFDDRAWAPSRIRQWHADPFGPFRPAAKIYVPIPTGGPAAQTSIVAAAPVVAYAPAVTTSIGGLSRTVLAASVIVHAPGVTVSLGGAQTTTISAASIVAYAPAVTRLVGGIQRTIGAAPVIAHAPAVSTASALTRAVATAALVVHAPAVVVTVGAATRTLASAGIVVHAPNVQTTTGTLTRVISAGSLVLHAPAVTVTGAAQTRIITATGIIWHAPPLANAWIAFMPVPPLAAPLDDLRTAVAVDNLSTRVALY